MKNVIWIKDVNKVDLNLLTWSNNFQLIFFL